MNTQNLVYIVLAMPFLVLVIPALLPAIQLQESDEDVDEEDLAPTGQVVLLLTKMIVR
jgi:hypothetical protein